MKKVSVFLAAIMMFVMVAANVGNAENVYAFAESEINYSEYERYSSAKAGARVSFSLSIDYDSAASFDVTGWKMALCPADNLTLDAAVFVCDLSNEDKHISTNPEFKYASISKYTSLDKDIPEGSYSTVVFQADGTSFLALPETLYVNKTLVSFDCDLVNNDGYAYAYVYSNSPALSAATCPTFYAADKATAVTSYNDYTVQQQGKNTVHVYRLNILDPAAFTLDSTSHTSLYYKVGTPVLESGNDGGVSPWATDANGFSYVTVFNLNEWNERYGLGLTISDPFVAPSSSSSSSSSAPAAVPVEQEVVLPNGEEVRMLSASPYEYVIADPEVVPTGSSFSNVPILVGDGYTLPLTAVEKFVGTGLEAAVFNMDLTAADGTAITQLGDYINVTLPIPASITLDEGKTIVMYRYEANGTLTRCDTVVDGNMVTFATNHFSLYVMVEQDATAGPALVKGASSTSASPKTADMSMLPAMMTAISGMGIAVVAMKKKNEI